MIATAVALFAGASDSAAQSRSLRERVREHGVIGIMSGSCGPLRGLKEIVEQTQLTVEGTISLAESRLTSEEDNIYTEYLIEVTRVFRAPTHIATRSIPGLTTEVSPFIAERPLPRPSAATKLHVRFVKPFHGQVTLDGRTVTAYSGFPALTVGQHVIVSAYVDAAIPAWVPFGVFEVRDGHIVHLDERRVKTEDYDSVAAFAAALANPPPTVPSNEK